MIKILLPKELQKRLINQLTKAGTREIGGILMGEHVAEGVFRVCDFSVQQQGGTWITFVRKIEESLTQSLRKFFRKTNFQYTKFNYLGEWHSHPSFSLTPSALDQESMWEIILDQSVGANFAILLIAKLEHGLFVGSVYLFAAGFEMVSGQLIMEGNDCNDR
jgi:proteasome lid subunit RPN8/RPN11